MFLELWEALEDAKDGGCYGLIAESGKLGKKKVRRNLVGARSLEGLGALGRLSLEGLLLSLYPQLHFLVDCLPLEGRRRGFTPRASVSSSITHRVLSLCLHLPSLLSLPFIICCGL